MGRGSSVVERRNHNPKVEGSNPFSAVAERYWLLAMSMVRVTSPGSIRLTPDGGVDSYFDSRRHKNAVHVVVPLEVEILGWCSRRLLRLLIERSWVRIPSS